MSLLIVPQTPLQRTRMTLGQPLPIVSLDSSRATRHPMGLSPRTRMSRMTTTPAHPFFLLRVSGNLSDQVSFPLWETGRRQPKFFSFYPPADFGNLRLSCSATSVVNNRPPSPEQMPVLRDAVASMIRLESSESYTRRLFKQWKTWCTRIRCLSTAAPLVAAQHKMN